MGRATGHRPRELASQTRYHPALRPPHHALAPRPQIISRGLRLKGGIELGDVTTGLHASTGRAEYKGRPL